MAEYFIKIVPVLAVMSLLLIGVVSAQGPTSRVKVLHASPDAPAVDILVNDAVAIENLAFKEIAGYVDLPSGEHNIKVVPTGLAGPVVIDTDVKLTQNREYTIAATGFLANIIPQVYEDKNAKTWGMHSRIRFVHLSPNAPEVDIRVRNGPQIFRDIIYLEDSEYERVRQGSYDIEVVLQDGTVFKTFEQVPIEGKKTYSIYAVGDVSNLEVILEEDTPKEKKYHGHMMKHEMSP